MREQVLILGGGAFAHSHGTILRRCGATVRTYLTRPKGRYGAAQVGEVIEPKNGLTLEALLGPRERFWVLPMSIDWMLWPEAKWLAAGPMLAPPLRGMRLERDRDFSRRLCLKYGVPVPEAVVAKNRLEAESVLNKTHKAWVLKNPLCAPDSPLHTIVCRTELETRSWLPYIDFAEGVFMQEYAGTLEIGHIVLVSGGSIHSLVTNQEYKLSMTGEMGPLAGVPLGGMVEADPDDRYGLARRLIHPLWPWLKSVKYHGPIQVTAAKVGGTWKVLEYNVRLGVTSGPLALAMLANPLDTLWLCACDQPLDPVFRPEARWGCSVSLVGYGFPYHQVPSPRFPVIVDEGAEADIWWNEVEWRDGLLWTKGQRIADVCAVGSDLEEVINQVYRTLSKIHVHGAYYRLDIGRHRWPPEDVMREASKCTPQQQ